MTDHEAPADALQQQRPHGKELDQRRHSRCAVHLQPAKEGQAHASLEIDLKARPFNGMAFKVFTQLLVQWGCEQKFPRQCVGRKHARKCAGIAGGAERLKRHGEMRKKPSTSGCRRPNAPAARRIRERGFAKGARRPQTQRIVVAIDLRLDGDRVVLVNVGQEA